MSNNELEELRARVEQLEEKQEKLEESAVDAQGREWSVSDLLSMGLTRRQALTALGIVAGGAPIGVAIYRAVGTAAAEASTSDGDDDVGSPDNRHDYFADGVDANSITTGKLSITELQQFEIENPTDISGSRSTNTTYTNNNNYAILVGVRWSVTSGSLDIDLRVGDTSNTLGAVDKRKISASGDYDHLISGIVPPGYDYQFNNFADGSLDGWAERGLTQ